MIHPKPRPVVSDAPAGLAKTPCTACGGEGSYDKGRTCQTCDGTGNMPQGVAVCPVCAGFGDLPSKDPFYAKKPLQNARCRACDGIGRRAPVPAVDVCLVCEGYGSLPSRHQFQKKDSHHNVRCRACKGSGVRERESAALSTPVAAIRTVICADCLGYGDLPGKHEEFKTEEYKHHVDCKTCDGTGVRTEFPEFPKDLEPPVAKRTAPRAPGDAAILLAGAAGGR
mmetsp:Transcript_3876/g.11203  ORF Transcript_3876/g.11203 Transcript_3876/m.11203 type:complete len:225 (+) Transcript_3876:3-677(+)